MIGKASFFTESSVKSLHPLCFQFQAASWRSKCSLASAAGVWGGSEIYPSEATPGHHLDTCDSVTRWEGLGVQ